VRAADRWFAVNLARPDDHSLLPAWLGEGPLDDPWRFVVARAARQPAATVVERARLLGLPAAVAVDPLPVAPPWCRVAARGTRNERRERGVPLVVDLSSLWAGPLCSHLLGLAGARVVKVESTRRPDGARSGPPAFFDLLNHGNASVALDFGSEAGRAQLRRLLQSADVVVESARPRALAQLGIDAGEFVASVPGLTWVSLTGYGRREPGAGWVAFGDDAAVAAGLAVATGRVAATDAGGGPPLFCGDAIADPLAGLHAAVSALAAWNGGGGRLLDVALRDVTAHALAFDAPAAEARVRRIENGGDAWEVVAGRERATVAAPRAREPAGAARPLGADTAAVLAELGVPC
jgi:crotonobetainyl-CoA:carnitine CoA-transferase CaiB-like acyl-CoA transferase